MSAKGWLRFPHYNTARLFYAISLLARAGGYSGRPDQVGEKPISREYLHLRQDFVPDLRQQQLWRMMAMSFMNWALVDCGASIRATRRLYLGGGG